MRERGRQDRRGVAAPLRARDPVHQANGSTRWTASPTADACSLWVARPNEDALRGAGELTLERLAQQPEDTTGAVHYLKIPNPKESENRGRRARRSHEPRLAQGDFPGRQGRLAPVGYISRLADALFSLTLLARGGSPAGTWRGARPVRALHGGRQRFTYGNVVRQDGWIVLRYWLFYAFNDWRSNVFGANDHEADWEKIFIYSRSRVRRGAARVGGLRRTRRRRRPEAPVGRSGAGEDRRASRGVRLRRLARDPLPGRVPN